MYFNVSQIMREQSGSTRRYTLDDSFVPGSDAHELPVQGRVRFLKTDKGVWISADLDTEADVVCCRCLTRFRQSVHMEIQEEYLPVPVEGMPADDEIIYGDNFYIDQNHILDLTDAARQYLDLSVPMKPLCREDCAGLCPTCGANLNETDCTCERSLTDPRWGPLLDLTTAGRGGKNGAS